MKDGVGEGLRRLAGGGGRGWYEELRRDSRTDLARSPGRRGGGLAPSNEGVSEKGRLYVARGKGFV